MKYLAGFVLFLRYLIILTAFIMTVTTLFLEWLADVMGKFTVKYFDISFIEERIMRR